MHAFTLNMYAMYKKHSLHKPYNLKLFQLYFIESYDNSKFDYEYARDRINDTSTLSELKHFNYLGEVFNYHIERLQAYYYLRAIGLVENMALV